MRTAITLLAVLLLSGCVDDRVKRAAAGADTATDQAIQDRKNAKTDEERKKVDDDYFTHVPPLIKATNQYLHGVNPDAPEKKP